MPYSNRIGNRRFRWAGQDYTTPDNFGNYPHSVHGVAWLRAWEVVSADGTSAAIRYRHAPDDHWPFAFEVVQHFELTPQALTARFVFTNTGTAAAPAGAGWHPYFPKRERSRLDIAIAGRWDSDATHLPVRREAQARIAGDVSGLDYDNCFDGWTGTARITDEKFLLELTSTLPYLVVYTPQDEDYFCVEPVSHVSNAIQMADPAAHGLRTLQPGESFESSMTTGGHGIVSNSSPIPEEDAPLGAGRRGPLDAGRVPAVAPRRAASLLLRHRRTPAAPLRPGHAKSCATGSSRPTWPASPPCATAPCCSPSATACGASTATPASARRSPRRRTIPRPSASTTASAMRRGASGWARSAMRASRRRRSTATTASAGCSVAADGITVSNGLGFSPNGRTMYWADTTSHTVFAFDVDRDAGAPVEPARVRRASRSSRPGQSLDAYGGRPDGAAVDAEGCYWVAMYEGGRLLRIAPTGEVLRDVRVPVRCPTMPCFGGPDLRTLYLTTTREKRPEAELAAQPWAGGVLSLKVDVPGLPTTFFG